MHLITVENKTFCAKMCLKSRFLGSKSWFWGDENLRVDLNLERLNDAKHR